jgi:branched-chain amino acid transport system ATP-binding protein
MSEYLRVKEVSKVFGGLVAVDNVSFKVEEGQLFGLIGPNGAGKTTLFNMIAGFYPVSEGDIFFKGNDITHLSAPGVARRGISRTFQNLRLFTRLSVLDNVMAGAHLQGRAGMIDALFGLPRHRKEEKEVRERAEHYLDLLGLSGKKEQLVTNLPYGDQRRVEIARALAAEPDMILLDEPSAGMNLKEARELADFIAWIREDLQKTILIIEHNMRVIMPITDYIVVINKGERIFSGTPKEVQGSSQVIEAYLGKEYAEKAKVLEDNYAYD